MAWVSIRVTGQDGRLVYIDGRYDDSAGKAPGPFLVTPGRHTFETLDRKKRVDNRARVNARPDQDQLSVAFAAVDPPEPTD